MNENTPRALVTGAGHRLGQAMAIHLAKLGHDVAVHYNSSDAGAQDTARAVRALGRRAEVLGADLLDDAATSGLLPAARAALGGEICVLVNNASIFEADEIGTATLESWDRHVGSNLKAPFFLTQAMAAQELAPGRDGQGEPVARGLIVNMVDQRVRKLTPHFATYTLAKSALWTLTQTAARALAPRIRVNAIGPGPTLPSPRQSAAHFLSQRAKTVLERGSDPEDICGALEYLLGARAVTGQLICVDGGQHLNWQTPDVRGAE